LTAEARPVELAYASARAWP